MELLNTELWQGWDSNLDLIIKTQAPDLFVKRGLATPQEDRYSEKMTLTYISILAKNLKKYRELPQLIYFEQQNTVTESNLVRQTREVTLRQKRLNCLRNEVIKGS